MNVVRLTQVKRASHGLTCTYIGHYSRGGTYAYLFFAIAYKGERSYAKTKKENYPVSSFAKYQTKDWDGVSPERHKICGRSQRD